MLDGNFEYNLYRSPKFKILSKSEHLNTQHVHSKHDLFFSFKKIKGTESLINLSTLSSNYGIDLHVKKQELKKNKIIYDTRLLEYRFNGFRTFWLIGSNGTYTDEQQVNIIHGLTNYLNTKNIKKGTLLIVPLERSLNVQMSLPIKEFSYFFSFNTNNLEKIEGFIPDIDKLTQ